MGEDNEFDALCERLENARNDAEYDIREGREALVCMGTDDCDQIAELLTKAYGAIVMGRRDTVLADQFAVLSGAFKGDDGDNA